jgi:hypothetical protein
VEAAELKDQLEQAVESLQSGPTPGLVEAQVGAFLRHSEDVGGRINAFRLIKHWLRTLTENDVAVRRAYDRPKSALNAALAQVPSLYYFEGD